MARSSGWEIDLSEVRKFERDLLRLNERGFPHAARDTINQLARSMQGRWRFEVKKRLTVRESYSWRSIIYKRATGTKLHRLAAFVGAMPYKDGAPNALKFLEEGQTRKGSKHGAFVPTRGARRSGNYAKKIRPTERYGSIAVPGRRVKTGSIRDQQRGTIHKALAEGKRHVFMETKAGNYAFFRIQGRKRTNKLGGRVKMEPIYTGKRGSIRTKPHPTMEPAYKAIMGSFPRAYAKHLTRQLERIRR